MQTQSLFYMKKKILISWWALWTDFDQEKGGVNFEGPNFEMHRHFYEGYDKHILLCTEKAESTRFEHLCAGIRKAFPDHQLDPRYVGLEDVIDFYEIKAKVEPILWEHKEAELHLFFSPGTSAMATVWFLLHQQSGLNSLLLQTAKAKNGGIPQIKYLEVKREPQLASFLIRETQQAANKIRAEHQYLLTKSLKPIYAQAATVAQANRGNILILGDSGTGKEHLASFIHKQSPRSKKAFLTINCAAFGDNLLESRLFGHQKGSFTGAVENHKGYFAEADGGSIFLDEIGDISPYMQQLLLRVLQDGEIAPIGGQPKKVDVRVIAATNRDLIEACEKGEFRWDLYYRLSTMELELPNLQARGRKELKAMLDFFIGQKQALFGRQDAIELSEKAENALLDYHFPGNVRELENLIEGFYMLGVAQIQNQHFPKRLKRSSLQSQSLKLEDIEAAHIQKVLAQLDYNLSATARTLGVALNTLKRKMKRYGMER